MKKIINYFKENPIIFISLTAFILLLLSKFRKGLVQTIEDKTPIKMPTITSSSPRGIRNNNPLNIRIGSSLKQPWKGQILENRKDKAFVEFETMEHGARAAIKLLQSYVARGTNTLDTIVTKWAPASDGNNPYSYVNLIIKDMAKKGFNIVKTWTPKTNEDYAQLAHSMAGVENGWKWQPPLTVFKNSLALL